MYRVPAPGKMGYHSRVEYNKQVMLISDNINSVNVKGGFINYGVVKTTYLLIKGSIPGPKRRLIRLVASIRPDKKADVSVPQVTKVIIESPQGC